MTSHSGRPDPRRSRPVPSDHGTAYRPSAPDATASAEWQDRSAQWQQEAPGYGAPHRTPEAAPAGASRMQSRRAVRARARARRRRLLRGGMLGVGSAAAVAVIAVAALTHAPGHHAAARADGPAAGSSTAVGAFGADAASGAPTAPTAPDPTATTAPGSVAQLPGLGADFLAKIPADTTQVFLDSGVAKDKNTGTGVLWTRGADGRWTPGPTWHTHNALRGWTTDHHENDLHSPIGVFTLTDAGGLDANPGTRLPYTRSAEFTSPGTGFEGESLADAFDYVVAIDYNHVPGSSPLDPRRPMGADRGGGIWVHVDHGGPTHGCVSLAKPDMAALLRALDPARHPVIVMGDAASLAA